jgi:hypothetical protein
MFLQIFALLLAPLISALPQLPEPTSNPDMQLTISNFHAYTSPPNLNYANWTAFLISDAAQRHSFICTYQCSGPLYDPNAWHDCEQRKGEGVDMSFQFTENFGRVGVKKGWIDPAG